MRICCKPASGFLLLVLSFPVVQADPAEPRYAIVIHGGAGGAVTGDADRQAVLQDALAAGEAMLKNGDSSLNTVEAVVRMLEDSSHFNAGKGAVCNAVGEHELDASIMDGRDRSAGAVGGVTTVKNPISLARRVMTETPHVLLVAGGADRFADTLEKDPQIERVSNRYFSTEAQTKKWLREKKKRETRDRQQEKSESLGTVGCVALDAHGNLAAATSTGGLINKRYGRIGDSPIPTAGTFADNETCGVSCTGVGEDFIRNAVAYDVSARMAYLDQPLDKAVEAVLFDADRPVRGGIIAISRQGQIVMRFNSAGMARAAADSTGRHEVIVGK